MKEFKLAKKYADDEPSKVGASHSFEYEIHIECDMERANIKEFIENAKSFYLTACWLENYDGSASKVELGINAATWRQLELRAYLLEGLSFPKEVDQLESEFGCDLFRLIKHDIETEWMKRAKEMKEAS